MSFMASKGLDVLMVSSEGKEWDEIVKREGCRHSILNMTRKISPIRDLFSLLSLVFLFLKERPTIVHTHTPKAGLLGMLAAWISRVPVRVHTIAGLPLMSTEGFKKKLLIFTEKLTYWSAHNVLANSFSIKSYLLDHRMIENSKLSIISQGSSNGIDLKRFSPEALKTNKINSIKSELNYDDNATYILSVGRMVNDKGIPELVTAFMALKKSRSDIKLVLLGPIEVERAAESLSKETLDFIQSDDDIIHVNWSDDVEYYMSVASFLVHASHREGMPNVILQAGAMNCPVICSSIPGNIDLVKHEETGFLFEKRNAKELLDLLRMACDDKDKLEVCSQNLHDFVSQNFERTHFHNCMLDFYSEKLELRQSN